MSNYFWHHLQMNLMVYGYVKDNKIHTSFPLAVQAVHYVVLWSAKMKEKPSQHDRSHLAYKQAFISANWTVSCFCKVFAW